MDWIDEEARFASASFDAGAFAKETFSECDVKEAEQIRADLKEKQQQTTSELISIVKKNYVRFSDSAKESASVESELSQLSGLMAELQSSLVAMKNNVVFGFENRKETRSQDSRSETKESSDGRVQFLAEAELELDVLLSERRLEAAVALLEQAQGPLEALRKRLLTERENTTKMASLTLTRIESRVSQVLFDPSHTCSS
jgi:hypothetical protein